MDSWNCRLHLQSDNSFPFEPPSLRTDMIDIPEEIKRAMMASTNKAFERYFRIEADKVRSLYERTKQISNPEQHLNNISRDIESAKILKFKE